MITCFKDFQPTYDLIPTPSGDNAGHKSWRCYGTVVARPTRSGCGAPAQALPRLQPRGQAVLSNFCRKTLLNPSWRCSSAANGKGENINGNFLFSCIPRRSRVQTLLWRPPSPSPPGVCPPGPLRALRSPPAAAPVAPDVVHHTGAGPGCLSPSQGWVPLPPVLLLPGGRIGPWDGRASWGRACPALSLSL